MRQLSAQLLTVSFAQTRRLNGEAKTTWSQEIVGLPRQHARGQRVIGGWARWGWSVRPLLAARQSAGSETDMADQQQLGASIGHGPQLLDNSSQPLAHCMASHFVCVRDWAFFARSRCAQMSSEVGERSQP